MRWLPLTWVLFSMAMLGACHRPAAVETRRTLSLQQPSELSVVDSLLWTQPDSALARLLPCYDTVSDRHYANLLLAELLYKNYYEQTNRGELLKAVGYYDSLANAHGTSRQRFLAARAHYINGVGYYELDSVVPACEEYLKAVEIMEESFSEKELVGKKAQFMAMTYTRLTDIFSDQYLHEQAIYFGKQSLPNYYRYDPSPRHIAWMLNKIGSHYEMMENYDTAVYYYKKSLGVLPDTNNLTYRDIATNYALLSYKMGENPRKTLDRLRNLLELTESKREYCSRCLSIGGIYYYEALYDTASLYLCRVYKGSNSINSRKQAAEWLIEICKAQGKDSEILEYASFLAPFATQEENKSAVKSQLAMLYNNHKLLGTEQRHYQKSKKQTTMTIVVTLGLLIVMLCCYYLYRNNRRKRQELEAKIKEEQYSHEIKQKALSGRLKQSNMVLRIHKKKANDLAKETDILRRKVEWDCLEDFMNEEICQKILIMLCGKTIKREAKKGAYPELQLNDVQLQTLSLAVEKHFQGFEKTLTDLYPKINRSGINQCLLYLLNLEETQIAALLSCDYTTVRKRSLRLKEAFHTKKDPRHFIRELVL